MIITIGFAIITALLLWFIIGAKGHWGTKAVVIAAALYFCLSVNMSVSKLSGWATTEKIPEEFYVHWIVVQEPNKKTGFEGAIFIWAQPFNTEKKKEDWEDYLIPFLEGKDEPRAYKLGYTRPLHEEANEAMQMIMSGKLVAGSVGKGEKGSSEAAEGDGQEEGEGGNSLSEGGDVNFHQLPPPVLPDKR